MSLFDSKNEYIRQKLKNEPDASAENIDHYAKKWEAANAKRSACFVATAVYGNANHPDVLTLRWWRDAALARSWGGRRFIACYYGLGPVIAAFVRKSPVLMRMVRRILAVVCRLVANEFTRSGARASCTQPRASPCGPDPVASRPKQAYCPSPRLFRFSGKDRPDWRE